MAASHRGAERDARLAVPTANLGVRPLGDALVLVALTDAVDRRQVADVLRGAHWRTVEVQSGDALPAAVSEEHADLVIVDVELMPNGGLGACLRLKSSAATHLVPVVLIGAGGDREERLAALQAGADHFLPRPIDLEELVARCRALLRTRGLVRTLEERRRGLRLRADFAGFLVHDLRSPLTSALANLELLCTTLGGEPDGDNPAALVSEAQHDLRRIAGMLRDVADLDRCERGHFVVVPAVFSLREVLVGVQRDLRQACAAVGVPLWLEGTTDVAVAADRALVERVVGNLVDNALRHAPRGAPVIVDVVGEAEVVRVSVVNGGTAVPAAERERIFEPYVQLATPGPARGAGLGLAFCRLVIEAHGGHIHVEEPPGGGAAFVFTLPRAGVATGPRDPRRPAAADGVR